MQTPLSNLAVPKAKKAALTTLGCKANQYDTAVLAELFKRQGYELVPFEETADVYVVNTCTVTAKADQDARRLVRQAYRRNPEAVKVVTGCYAQVSPQEMALIEGVNYIVGNNHKDRIVALVESQDNSAKPHIIVDEILKDKSFSTFGVQLFGHRARAFLKIQDGCNQFCSFCIIPFARGQNRSVSSSVVMRELFRLAEEGYEEVVLTGIHLGTYGRDLDASFSLLQLMQEIEQEKPLKRVRLSSIDPEEVTEEIKELLLHSKVFCPYLHIPLQSGDNLILERMRRRYTRETFIDLVQSIKSVRPDFCIGTDVMVGFPGEDDAAFERSCDAIVEAGVDYSHVFSYSSREGTKAAQWPDHVASEIKKSRSDRLRAISARQRETFNRQFIGKAVQVIWEHPKRNDGWIKGVTPEYLSVHIPLPPEWMQKGAVPPSSWVSVTEWRDDDVWGELCPQH